MTESKVQSRVPVGEMLPKQGRGPRLWSPQVLIATALVLCAGLIIAWIDTRSRWDDTGITAGALATAAALGSFARIPPWLASALVAGPILAAELSGGMGVLLAIPFALAGAYAGVYLRRRIAAS
jgi:hypothetical protein